MANHNFNEILKKREQEERARLEGAKESGEMKLDDTQRVKVLSPGRLVAKRFWRNKLAIVGTAILVFMFLFSFVGPMFYSYQQTEVFYKFAMQKTNYATAAIRAEYINLTVDDSIAVSSSMGNMMTSYILQMEEEGVTSMEVMDADENVFIVDKIYDGVYSLSAMRPEKVGELTDFSEVGIWNKGTGVTLKVASPGDGFADAASAAINAKQSVFEYNGEWYLAQSTGGKGVIYNLYGLSDGVYTGEGDAAFQDAMLDGMSAGAFTYDGQEYTVSLGTSAVTVYGEVTKQAALLSTTKVFDSYQASGTFSDEFKAEALMALGDEMTFTADGAKYTIENDGAVDRIYDADGVEVAEISGVVIRRYNGEDSMTLEIKQAIRDVIDTMTANGEKTHTFTHVLPQMDETGNYVYDENGNLLYIDTEIDIEQKVGQYVLTCEQVTHLIDIYGSPTKAHIFGTDCDGYDVLSRMMYGGRISLVVGFVVVILECFLGIILGGIAGYFGKWVDTLIMRLVDVFYCIPSTPILIIMGALFDEMKMNAYVRLMWMMAILGFLGWAGIARLVRGQILSLREQEFMTAAEATGISVPRRIFRHLLPNVMPQLIVNATMGLGGVIITESTLSFLGLGVKHPLATWGTMINSITSSNENLLRYAYIWIPVGLLICLTVIAFNFVGDGLRDAFDPKMKQ